VGTLPIMTRQTKIVVTLGPAVATAEAIDGLVAAGMDVARLNFSHGDHDTHRKLATFVREAATRQKRAVAILQDIQGPKIRVGTFPDGGIRLKSGDRVSLVAGMGLGDASRIEIGYPRLVNDVGVGSEVVLADGLVRMRVTEQTRDRLVAEVIEGGPVGDHRGAAFPKANLRVSAVTEKDKVDLAFGRELEVDFVAASFVRSAADVERVRQLSGVPVIAKVELAVAFENLDAILAVADGVMVARGDLGVEMPLERLPFVQQDILRRTNAAGLISVTATEMLESMIHSTRPTRAEVTDVATAVMEGTDAVMLSGETAIGDYPIETVAMMDRNPGRGRPSTSRPSVDQLPCRAGRLCVCDGESCRGSGDGSRSRHHRCLHRVWQYGTVALEIPSWSGDHGFQPRGAHTPQNGDLPGRDSCRLRTTRLDRCDDRVRRPLPRRARRVCGR